MNCRRGARAAQEGIFDAFPNSDVRVLIVWTNIFRSDNADEATEAAGLVQHPNVQHYYDPAGNVSQSLAPLLAMPTLANVIQRLGEDGQKLRKYYSAEMADGPARLYDTYLAFAPGTSWRDAPPAPVDWMTQLDPTLWVGINAEHFQYDLPAALRKTVAAHTHHQTSPIND